MADTLFPTTAGDSGDEGPLLDHVRRVESNREGARAVVIHLSELRVTNRQPHHVRIAIRSFDNLVNNHDAHLYVTANKDLVLICRHVRLADLEAAVYKIQALFSEDPATAALPGQEDRFVTWYDLKGDFTRFRQWVQRMAELAAERKAAIEAGTLAPDPGPGKPLDPAELSAIARRLRQTRVAGLIQQQLAVRIGARGASEVLFRENFMSMAELGKRIAPGVDLFGNVWLFQYLTEEIDRRLLAVMCRRDFSASTRPISLNLNISTVLAPEFQQFHQHVGDQAGKVVIELQKIDVFSDMAAYWYARDWLQDNGYRVLIDGLNPLSLQFFDPGLLRADFVKVAWGPEFAGTVPEARMRETRDVVARVGPERMVIARVDTEEAIRWGLNLGIERYQGRFLDKLVAAMAAKQMQIPGGRRTEGADA